MMLKDLLRPLPGTRQLSLLRQRARFGDSASYWERAYGRGETSGTGSYGDLAQRKADFLNEFVRMHAISTVLELGCGDGNQLSLADYPSYVGLDVSRTAIGLCQRRFSDDRTKSFFLYDGGCFWDAAHLFTAELALSLDVVYHLVEDDVFSTYMSHLFAAARRFVIIYSTNASSYGDAPHVRHRNFSRWVEENCAEWRLVVTRRGPYEGRNRADFYIYERAR